MWRLAPWFEARIMRRTRCRCKRRVSRAPALRGHEAFRRLLLEASRSARTRNPSPPRRRRRHHFRPRGPVPVDGGLRGGHDDRAGGRQAAANVRLRRRPIPPWRRAAAARQLHARVVRPPRGFGFDLVLSRWHPIGPNALRKRRPPRAGVRLLERLVIARDPGEPASRTQGPRGGSLYQALRRLISSRTIELCPRIDASASNPPFRFSSWSGC